MLEPMRKKGENSMKSRYCDFIQPHWLNLARATGDIPQTFISRSNVWQIFFIIYVSVPAEEKRHQADGMETTVMKNNLAKQGHQGRWCRRNHGAEAAPENRWKRPAKPKEGAYHSPATAILCQNHDIMAVV